jgi:thioesterase domain-containing protein
MSTPARPARAMLPAELAQYIHAHIPLTRAMEVSVLSIEASAITLQAPLAPNINHRQSVFGGSAAALAILAGWALLHVRLRAEGVAARLVIQRNTMEFRHPILGTFSARARLEHPQRWKLFTSTLARKGKARIAVSAELEHTEQVVATFTGQFVALAEAVTKAPRAARAGA